MKLQVRSRPGTRGSVNLHRLFVKLLPRLFSIHFDFYAPASNKNEEERNAAFRAVSRPSLRIKAPRVKMLGTTSSRWCIGMFSWSGSSALRVTCALTCIRFHWIIDCKMPWAVLSLLISLQAESNSGQQFVMLNWNWGNRKIVSKLVEHLIIPCIILHRFIWKQ